MPSVTSIVRFLERRLAPALLSAAGVTLLAAGLLGYTAQPAGADLPVPSPVAGTFAVEPTPPLPAETAGPTESAGTSPTPAPAGSAAISPTPGATASQPVATRVVVPALKIDLPVISGDRDPPGPDGKPFPYCNVAEYLSAYHQPGDEGTTYIFAHARTGMFLSLLEASQVNGGRAMLGYTVLVYTSDAKVYWYSVTRVKRHATDFSLADNVPPGASQVILQTSEGPIGTVEKLQVAAAFQLVQPADNADAQPAAHPVAWPHPPCN
jgi:hypothetical protein